VWDAGYKGRSQALLTVYNPHGWRVRQNARIMQIVFIHLAKSVDSELVYQGRFQLENLLEPEIREVR
jgi:dUTP pyrophosphatase